MKVFLQGALFIFSVVICPLTTLAQNNPHQLLLSGNADKTLVQIQANPAIDADSAYRLISSWSHYPELKQTGYDYTYYYTDPAFGKIPLHVYIPGTYKSTQKNSCVLLLHGAVGMSHFSDIDSTAATDDDVLFNTFKADNYIIIRPLADATKDFNWVVSKRNNDFTYRPNLTFAALNSIVISLKKVLNIDDSKVFAAGHSDGSDGAVALGVYAPDTFAGFVVYNSMLNVIFAWDFFIRNIQNRPAYIVHSSLDNLRPIGITRTIIDSLLKFDDKILYKEYIGYNHFDKHLDKDLPLAGEFMKGISRNPFQTRLYWETANNEPYNSCDWLKVTGINKALSPAGWHHPFDVNATITHQGKVINFLYYDHLDKSAAVKARYNNNVFDIKTSGATEIELLISPVMVNLENDIIVMINGKQVYKGKVKADKNFILNGFKNTMDRDALWVNSIKVKVDGTDF